jgi:rhodanese-related sulfurtransferase
MRYIIDVRTKEEFDTQKVEGAIHHDIMGMMYGSYPDVPKDAEILVYCESGNRSMMACNMLIQNGYTNVIDAGSIENLINTNI